MQSRVHKVCDMVSEGTVVKGGGQAWAPSLTDTSSCMSPLTSSFPPPPIYTPHLSPFLHLVNYGESFILMKCISLVMWSSGGCLRFTIALSFLSARLPQSQSSPDAKGKFHTQTRRYKEDIKKRENISMLCALLDVFF